MGLDAREAIEVLVKGGNNPRKVGAAQLQSDIFTYGADRDNSCGSFGKRLGTFQKNAS